MTSAGAETSIGGPNPPAVGSPRKVPRLTACARSMRFEWAFHAYAAFAIAVAAPMYGRLIHRTQFLISLEPITLILFVLVWSVVIPGALIGLIGVARIGGFLAGNRLVSCLIGASASVSFLGLLSHRAGHIDLAWLILFGCCGAGWFIGVRYSSTVWLKELLTLSFWGTFLFPIALLATYLKYSARPVLADHLTVGNPIPVIVVVFDCLSSINLMDERQRIDKDRFPRFAELAATSGWYRNCSSVHPRTDHAVPAILSGLRPRGPRVPTLEQYPQNLFTLLNSTGKYRLTALEPVTTLCPRDPLRDRAKPRIWPQWLLLNRTLATVYLHDLLPNGVPLDPPRVPLAWFGLEQMAAYDRNQREGQIRSNWDVDRANQFHHLIDCLDGDVRPALWFGHFALPHMPWIYLPTGRITQNDVGLRSNWGAYGFGWENWLDDDRIVTQAHQQHLLQLQYADRLLGELIDQMRHVGVFDRCLFVVLADHGVSFRPGMSSRAPKGLNLTELMSVPLFIKLPEQTSGDVLDINVETIDVLPTILDVLKLKPPVPLDGRSVFDPNFSERPFKTFSDEKHAFEVSNSVEARYQALAEQLARLGTGADPQRIFRIGPHPEFLEQPIANFRQINIPPIWIHPMNFASTVDYGTSGLVPAILSAQFKMKVARNGPIQFAIAVNDTICGTTESYRAEPLRDFWRVMLPESAFRSGKNQIRIFEIHNDDLGLALSECQIGEKSKGPEDLESL
jgi:hypothetical protein